MMGLLTHLILSTCLARADAVPKPENDVVVSVTYQGKPLADVQFKAVLLQLVAPPELRGPTRHGAEQLARRERQVSATSEWATLPLTEANGWRWAYGSSDGPAEGAAALFLLIISYLAAGACSLLGVI
jgi:hypothetical protein